MTPRLVITGASGYLGRHLAPRAAARADVVAVSGRRADRVTAGTVAVLDVTDGAAVAAAVARWRPTAVIHAAAANPGTPDAALWPVNVDGSRHVAAAAARVGARLVHVSSDVVFDGRLAPYADGATPSPVNAYGRAKAAAEAAVAAAHPGAAIVRTSLIYGLAEIDRSTAGFAARLAHGGRLTLWTDVIRQPVEAGHLADALVALALDLPAVAGTVNVAGTQAMSRHAFGRRMLAFWGVGGLDRIEAGRAADLPDGGVPLDLRLDLTRARGLFPTLLSGVDDHVPA